MSDHSSHDAAQIGTLEDRHLFQNYGRRQIVLVRGQGCYVYDDQGKQYLDFISGIGVNALGHGHARGDRGNLRSSRHLDALLEPLCPPLPGPLAKSSRG